MPGRIVFSGAQYNSERQSQEDAAGKRLRAYVYYCDTCGRYGGFWRTDQDMKAAEADGRMRMQGWTRTRKTPGGWRCEKHNERWQRELEQAPTTHV